MPLVDLIILSLIQGLTEFLPISSSGHLVLVHQFFDHDSLSTSRLLDIAVHLGTLLSVLVYLHKDILQMLKNLITFGRGQQDNYKLLMALIVASLPVIVCGFILNAYTPSWLVDPVVIATTMIVFALFLWWSDKAPQAYTSLDYLTLRQALWIGIAQVLALIPGTSRAGITMTAGRFLGYSRVEAARFSLLLGCVAIAGAGTLGGYDLYTHVQDTGEIQIGIDAALAFILSFFAGWISIALMMSWIAKTDFKVFVVYRLGLGTLLFALIGFDIL